MFTASFVPHFSINGIATALAKLNVNFFILATNRLVVNPNRIAQTTGVVCVNAIWDFLECYFICHVYAFW